MCQWQIRRNPKPYHEILYHIAKGLSCNLGNATPPGAPPDGQTQDCSSGAARGDCEACVSSKYVWSLLVAAWKSTFLLPAMTSRPHFHRPLRFR